MSLYNFHQSFYSLKIDQSALRFAKKRSHLGKSWKNTVISWPRGERTKKIIRPPLR